MEHDADDKLAAVERLADDEHHLAVVSTSRADGSVQSSVVNAGVLPHPVTGERVVGFVTYGRSKLANLRRRPRASLVFRSGWQWIAVEGPCDIAGPDDPLEGLAPTAVPELLREVFRAAGGEHDDWEQYDRTMASERRVAILVRPERVYSNPVSSA